ncbi:glycoside hydrolase family 75 protein [Burkholderia vietnamiensis]|uniref:glycoside hydrolase family 75 protein n=1 Tax=Burkholderia vietnamiensis TaxID=60552 RepID=UPI00264E110D|nr:glycoside hydrolase family 75 protein [Burkholderia vietnamiensis]MDN7408015.1 glycoside hydrolase family 75 protein [Burkholderia vietnamiensis]
MLKLFASSFLMLSALHARAETYTPPAASAGVFAGITLTGAPVASDWKAATDECSATGTVGGQHVQGCGRWCDDQLRVNGKRNSKCTKPGQVLSKPNPTENTVLLKLRDGAILFDAKMSLDTDGAGTLQGDQTRQAETSLKYANGKSLDAGRIPFIVIPRALVTQAGIHLGDLAAVVSGRQIAYAVVGDGGPKYSLGEGSIKLHQELGHSVCIATNPASGDCTRVRDVDLPAPVIYIVFPGSHRALCAFAQLWFRPISQNKLTTTGRCCSES